jgi:hypothetical protein
VAASSSSSIAARLGPAALHYTDNNDLSGHPGTAGRMGIYFESYLFHVVAGCRPTAGLPERMPFLAEARNKYNQ